MTQCSISVAFETDSPESSDRAHQLAAALGIPLAGAGCTGEDLRLVVTRDRLELREADRQTGPVYIDFVGGKLGVRRRQGRLVHDPLVRAIGRKGRDETWQVFDATAGLGRDAFLMAWAGCRVTLAERSPVVAALLEDGLARAMNDAEVGSVVRERLHLVRGDAREILSVLPEAQRPDAVYIDPMFPHRAKTALSKKEMRLCRLVAGDDPDAAELLEVARRVARHRVAVKRWLHAPPLAGAPGVQYKGQSIRYDVYLA